MSTQHWLTWTAKRAAADGYKDTSQIIKSQAFLYPLFRENLKGVF